MLVELRIRNFAIIKELELVLRSGLTALSGETGAGKSIIINAMNLILGARASADLIRTGCDHAKLEALFSIPLHGALRNVLKDSHIECDQELLITRTIHREGRNSILINGSMATLQMLSRLGPFLVSISGQHENQLLLKPDNHLYLLDEFAGLSQQRSELSTLFADHQAKKRKLRGLMREMETLAQSRELAKFQVEEIEKAEIRPSEDTTLAEEKTRLQHAEELLETALEGYLALYEKGDSAVSILSICAKRVEKAAEIDPRLASVKEELWEMVAKVEDAAFSLRDFQKAVDLDPESLEQVCDRLDLLNELKRKYGPTLEDVLRFRDEHASVVCDVDEKQAVVSRLEQELHHTETDMLSRARVLSTERRRASKDLEQAVERELVQLHLKDTSFGVRFYDTPPGGGSEEERMEGLTAEGFDRAEFVIAPNVGEELRPLSRIASGGELSRIMLALKTILAKTGAVDTIVFDEIDSGISGATAEVVGEKLLSLSAYHQILCITHLPQIASQGQFHLLVRKQVADGRTHTSITELREGERVEEIARLLGGREITARAVARAREMLTAPT